MLARVAENIFWMSRYLERVDGTVRLIKAHTHFLLDSPNTNAIDGWSPLLAVMGIESEYFEHYQYVTGANVSTFLVTDKRNPGSLASSVNAVRYNLRACRDLVPTSLYATINNLCLTVKKTDSPDFSIANKHILLAEIEQQMLAIVGAVDSTMNRDQSYQFMRIGTYLERADMTSHTRCTLGQFTAKKDAVALVPFENRQWETVLRSVSALQMYRRSCGPVAGPDVLAYLLQSTESPRSYRYCIGQIRDRIRNIGGAETAIAALDQLQQLLACADINALANNPTELHQFVDDLELHLANVSDAIASSYYSPKEI